jgi:D-beta-D-heptose 7-phosphate kinase/D-beta-D-heptose 1-phosphate adenosyltransferase
MLPDNIKPVVVVGDVMLDVTIHGAADRISPEAPVPVVRREMTVEVLGGAANVAANIAAMGAPVKLISVVGDDQAAHRMRQACYDAGVGCYLHADRTRPTTTKTRIVSRGHQLVRVDEEVSHPIPMDIQTKIISQVKLALEGAGALVISDYAKGVLTDRVLQQIITAATERVMVIVDPKSADWTRYEGADVIKPNAGELAQASSRKTGTDAEVEAAGYWMLAGHSVGVIVCTRAEEGASIIRDGVDATHIRGTPRQVRDVQGAGDTFLAALAVGMSAGEALDDAVDLAVRASGIAVDRPGTAVVTRDDLLASRETVGVANGCFDLFHPGHLHLIRAAQAECDRLVVLVNSDESVRALKGPDRPVWNEVIRSEMVRSHLRACDDVMVFRSEHELAGLIEGLAPDVLVKSEEYRGKPIVGAEFAGRVCYVHRLDDHSTTRIVDSLRRAV